MTTEIQKSLQLRFHGKILDHLGIQMYQSPVAAVAELVANAWDAEAELVNIRLPQELGDDSELVISDNGVGMTLEECQMRFLNVGWNRREDNPAATTLEKNRPVLGRKGIGKFAGFGIAMEMIIETTSKETGEKTVFSLDLDELRQGDYVNTSPATIDVTEYAPPHHSRQTFHGTTIRLRKLSMRRRPSPAQFGRSMARRFLLHQRAEDFQVMVNDQNLPEADDLELVEYVYPRDYHRDKLPENITIHNDGWGTEQLSDGNSIRWQVRFYRDTIGEEELRGISIFARQKIAQAPFFFNLSGGLGGQHGQQYLSGKVEADYLDELNVDVIATERQRINWEHDETHPLLEWGKRRTQELLKLWKERRAEHRVQILEERLAPFTERLDGLSSPERRTVKTALKRIAGIETLNQNQFQGLCEAILTAWEHGRLKTLVDKIAQSADLQEGDLLAILAEAQVVTALHTAEAVQAKLLVIDGLKRRIEEKELENAVRDYIAKSPWLISPEWETFRRETRVTHLIEAAADKANIFALEDWKGRVDLALSSGDTLLILEFMRPGLKLNDDHLFRFEKYIRAVALSVQSNTTGPLRKTVGYIVADRIDEDPIVLDKITELEKRAMYATRWHDLLENALAQWKEFMFGLVERNPEDRRLQALKPAQ